MSCKLFTKCHAQFLTELIVHKNDFYRGKYIVCGEAMDHSEDVFQESCFETKIHREETEDLQIGVKAIIVIAITIVIFVVIYNIIYQVNIKRPKILR